MDKNHGWIRIRLAGEDGGWGVKAGAHFGLATALERSQTGGTIEVGQPYVQAAVVVGDDAHAYEATLRPMTPEQARGFAKLIEKAADIAEKLGSMVAPKS